VGVAIEMMIDENNTFQLNFYSSIKTVGATVLGGLWALEWAWHSAETNWRCVRSSGICTKSQLPSSYSFRDLSVHPDRHGYG